MTIGGEGGNGRYERTAEIRKKISATEKGKIISDETKKKISKAQSGKNNPMYGRKGKKSPNFGKRHSDETKRKMSNSHIGIKPTKESKRKNSISNSKWFIVENIKNRQSFLVHGLKDFCKKYNLSYYSMKNIVRGLYKIHKKTWTVKRFEV